jgi:hypothetical protein
MLMIPHCLDNWLTDGGEVSLTHRSRYTLHKERSSASGTHFSLVPSISQDLAQPEGLGTLKKSILLIKSRTRVLLNHYHTAHLMSSV